MTRAPSKRDRIPEILERLAAGETLRAICRDEGMPDPSTVLRWKDADADLAQRYARAREDGYHAMAEQCLEIADDSGFDATVGEDGRVRVDNEAIARAKLRFDARRWLLSKALPKVYGDRQQVDVVSHDMSEEDIDAALQRRLGNAATR